MKKLFLLLLSFLFLPLAYGATPIITGQSSTDGLYLGSVRTDELIMGEHTYGYFSGTDTLFGIDTVKTRWMQLGQIVQEKDSLSGISLSSNKWLTLFDPRYLSLWVRRSLVQGDSTNTTYARIEYSDDTTSIAENASGASTFIVTGAVDSVWHDTWVFDPPPVATGTTGWIIYPIQCYDYSCFTRVVFWSSIDDTGKVEWKLKPKH